MCRIKHDCGCCIGFRPEREAQTDEEYATMPGWCPQRSGTNSANEACASHDCFMVATGCHEDEDDDCNPISEEDDGNT